MCAVSCKACPLRKKSLFSEMTSEEVEFMQKFKAGELAVGPGTTILMEGSNAPQLYTVLEGMGTRFATLENGRRQVINFVFPGDFVGLQAGLMGEMKHSVVSTTDMILCVFNRSELWQLYRAQPSRAYDLTWISAVEEHFLGETIATLGQRDATQRIAWALLRLHERVRAVELGNARTVPLPFRQQDLADALGLSLVHTNKTLARLKARGIANWTDGKLTIDDVEALAELGLVDAQKPERRPLM